VTQKETVLRGNWRRIPLESSVSRVTWSWTFLGCWAHEL